MYDQHFIDPGSSGAMLGASDQYGASQPKIGFGPAREIPTTLSTSVAALRTWVLGAQAGQLEAYVSELGRLREYVTLLTGKGFVTPHVMSNPTGAAVYVVQRTRAIIRPGQL